MDRSLEVRTPESVAFAFALAGLGSRFLAVVADGLVQGLLIFGLLSGFFWAAARMHRGAKLEANLGAAVVLFVAFGVLFGYFVVFETLWNGQTPGKRLLGIRVVRDGGYPIDFTAALIRNLIRIAEWLFGFYLVAAVSALLSSENKRLGDFAAGTVVVRESRVARPKAGAGSAERYAATSLLSGDERAIVFRFLERRDGLPSAKRAELAARLAAIVRPRVSPDLARLDDEGLLERL